MLEWFDDQAKGIILWLCYIFKVRNRSSAQNSGQTYLVRSDNSATLLGVAPRRCDT